MLLIIFLGLIAKLVFVSGDCDVGTQKVDNFDFHRASGTWYILLHSPNDTEKILSCLVARYAFPVGNTSLITLEAYDISAQSTVTIYGNATNWSDIGYWDESYPPPSIWSGRYYVIAIDYDRYFISELCSLKSNELYVYVSYRSKHPDEETKKKVQEELEKNNIDIEELVEWRADNCQQAGPSTEGGSSV